MSEYVAPLHDMQFILSHVVGIDKLARLPGCEEVTEDVVNAILEEAGRFACGVLSPSNTVGDIEGCRLENGVVETATGWKDAYGQFCEAGWIGLAMPSQYGGQDLPKSVTAPVHEMWFAANLAFSVMPTMAVGSVDTLLRSASPLLKDRYLPKMVLGQWTATMDLTEPNAGSDLSAIRTRAEPHPDGNYRLFGQKIFITYGEHDMAENIIHLVLARLPDAPAGVRGISMFLVPKHLVNEDGTLGARNDMRCISIEHKMGIHGSPTCTMSYGDVDGAVGYLVGEPGRGLEYMFVMVNESRFNVGLQGIALGDRAYQAALVYARERIQGRDGITGEQNVPIIRHPDVKRMLLSMRANVMATRMLAYFAAGLFDQARHNPNETTAARCQALIDLLMPVVKGWSTELGFETANLGLQIHGGMGFVEETGVAQYLRDVRITSIYEGTTAIQANDLISRKILRDDATTLNLLIDEIRVTVSQAMGTNDYFSLGATLEQSLALLESVRDWILDRDRVSVGDLFAGGVSFLHMLGTICGAWQMTRAALAAHGLLLEGQGNATYLRGIVDLAKYYFAQVLPRATMHATLLQQAGPSILRSSDAAL